MKKNVRVFGFVRRHWRLFVGILLLLMLPTTTEAQRFSNRRPVSIVLRSFCGNRHHL